MANRNIGKIEIMDTTLREGEQTSGVSFTSSEKLGITQLLLRELNVPRVEVASARVSTGEHKSVREICRWARENGYIDSIEILGFIDSHNSVNWVKEVGGRVINLLVKGSENHCINQLHKTKEQHLADVADEVRYAASLGFDVNVYLEDWSNGIKYSREYVYFMMNNLVKMPIRRVMLPDTLGVFNPNQVYGYGTRMVERYPDVHFDFHGHNDYDLASANSFAAGLVGFKGIHCTINGLGERAGNAPLSSVVAIVHDMLKKKTGIDESKINKVSRIVESFSGVVIPGNKPIIGENVFTQCAGIHADGDNKNHLYCNGLLPERFGREREYALGKTSGKANIKNNLKSMGIELSEDEVKKVTDRIIQLGDKKEIVTPSDLPYIIADVLKHDVAHNKVKIINYALSLSQGLHPTAIVKLEIDGVEYQESAAGDGQYDAFVKAVRKIYKKRRNHDFPLLLNYAVSIPPGGRTDALVQTVITWEFNGTNFKTRGLDADQTEAAIQATVKMLNIIENL